MERRIKKTTKKKKEERTWMEQEDREIKGNFPTPKTEQFCRVLLLLCSSGLHSQSLQMLEENLKAHVVREDYVGPHSHLMGIVVSS